MCGYHNVNVAGNRNVSCDACGRQFNVNPREDCVTPCPRCGHKNDIDEKKRRLGRLKAKYA